MKLATKYYKQGGSFSLPGGFRVRVEILGKDDAQDMMGSQVLAAYWQEEHLITLKRSRSNKQRKADLEHELQHCCIDWIDHFIRKAKVSSSQK